MFLAESIDGQVIVVILMVLFAGAKALIEKLQSKGAPPIEEVDNDPYDVEEAYDEYERQLEERRQQVLRRQQQTTAPPPLPISPKEVEVYVPQKVVKPKLSAAEEKALANFNKGRNRRSAKKPEIAATARARALRVLSSPYAARDAIVLSEILGPPKGMR